MGALIRALGFVARHGRWGLVIGILAGFAAPGLALILRDWLPEMIGGLLFLTALRIGPVLAFGGFASARLTLRNVLIYQLAMPLAALGLLGAAGLGGTTVALAVVLMLAAPPITGSPNFTILVGHDPAPALRQLVLGTALFPLTVLPIFWLLPQLGSAVAALSAALWLFAIIAGSISLGFVARAAALASPDRDQLAAIDGVTVIALAVIVVGLMSAVRATLVDTPGLFAGWLALAFALNLGFQIAARLALPNTSARVAQSIIAGNRNIAIFVVALPEEVTATLLIFIGCYQVPMYLTPVLLGHLYRPE